MVLNLHKHYYIFSFVVFLAFHANPTDCPLLSSANNISTSDINDSINPRKQRVFGKVINLDTMPVPKKTLAGNPVVVPFINNVFNASVPVVVDVPPNLIIKIPGQNSIPKPRVFEAVIDTCRFEQPERVRSLPPRFKERFTSNIQYVSKEHGLDATRMIREIYQDKNSDIWFASGNLIKYDGTFFTHYRNVVFDKGKYNVSAESITEDSKGNMWFTSGTGKIFQYDGDIVKEYGIYKNGERQEAGRLSSIIEDRKGNIWIGGNDNGLFKYEPGSGAYPNGRFIHYTEKEGLIGNSVKCIVEDKDGNIWVGTSGHWGAGVGTGMCKFELGSNQYPDGRFIHYSTNEGLSNNDVKSLVEDRDGKLWIGTYGGGVNIFDGRSFTHLTEKEGLSNNLVLDVYEDRNGSLWIATYGGGVCKFTHGFSGLANGSFTYYKMHSNYLQSIFEDDNGYMWFGEAGESVNVFRVKSFSHLTSDNGMSLKFVKSLFEDTEGNVWFCDCCSGGGICKFDGKSFKYFTSNEGLCSDSLTSIIQDSKGNIWSGSMGGGICSFDGEYFTYYTKKTGLASNFVTYLYEDKSGIIWVGTKDNGVCKFDGSTFTQYTKGDGLCDNHITCIIEDRKGNLWFGSQNNGIDKFDGAHIVNYSEDDGLVTNSVSSLMEDGKGNIWIGGEGATRLVYGLDGTSFELSHFKALAKGRVKFIVEDNTGNIWIGTENGLNLLIMPDNGIMDSLQTYVFEKGDGLKGNNPMINSAFVSSKNIFFYGHNSAIAMLDLNTFQLPSRSPIIHLDNIELGQNFIDYRELSDAIKADKPFLIGANNDIGLNEVSFTSVASYRNYPINLELPYHINNITFNFSATYWQALHKIRYQYKLEGSDWDWRPATKETKATYNNLPYGKYAFMVKAVGGAQKWSDTFKYSFIIRPPWWYSWWAYVLYSAALLVLIYAWRRDDLKRQRLRQKLEIEHVQTEKLEELDKMKSRFFANISHEFRTPLTLILGPLQSMISKATGKGLKKDLLIMDRNARHLHNLINQLLNLSKLDAGKMKLQARQENIVSLARLFVQSFESYATQRKIHLGFISGFDEIIVYVDREKIEKILNNLLSNAFKFTREGGNIEVGVNSLQSADGSQQSAVCSRQCVEIKVSDTGAGIPRERVKHLFDRFYQADDSYATDQEGSGIGLALTKELVELHSGKITVESIVGKGTTFTVLLPIGNSHLKTDEILEKQSFVAEGVNLNLTASFKPYEEQKQIHEGLPINTLHASSPIVLLVEDNTDLRLYIRGFLDQDYNVIEAEDGKVGLAKAIDIVPDLIISDVMMPNMDGYQLCNKVKVDERTSHIPIILLTARASMESKIEGFETGADDFITKPFEPQELQVRVKNLIEQRNKLKERYKKEMGMEETVPITVLPTINQQFLDKAKNIVNQNMDESDFSVEDFAKEIGMSRVQLHRKLRALIDQSSSEFIRSQRLEHAAVLLLQGKGNISEIAYDTGFNSPTYFTSSFSKQFGMSPSEYIIKNSSL
jgi:signal transduction histidine kinase/ligand-binding sensor domain-containing protein/DNA-binding response OmpR family regulator